MKLIISQKFKKATMSRVPDPIRDFVNKIENLAYDLNTGKVKLSSAEDILTKLAFEVKESQAIPMDGMADGGAPYTEDEMQVTDEAELRAQMGDRIEEIKLRIEAGSATREDMAELDQLQLSYGEMI